MAEKPRDPKIEALQRKLDILRATQNLVTRSINPNLDTQLQDPANVKPMQGRALGPGMYFAPNAEVSEKYWGKLGGTAYSPKVGVVDALKIMASKGYAGAQDVSDLGVRLDKGDTVNSPSVRKLMDAGYMGYRGNAKPDLSDAVEVTNWKVGAKDGLKLKKLPGTTVNMGLGALNVLGFLPLLAQGGRIVSGRETLPEFTRGDFRG